MTKKIKLLIVSNETLQPWTTWLAKTQELMQWFAPKVDLSADVVRTSFPSIPFVSYSSNDLSQNALNNLQGIDLAWYDQNVTWRAKGYDIVLFVVPMGQWKATNSARGWRTDRDQGPVELQIGCLENEEMQWPNFPLMESFFQLARHEILHALFMIIYGGQPATCDTTHLYQTNALAEADHKAQGCDPTHFWWNKGQLDSALDELVFPVPNNDEEIALIRRIFEILLTHLNTKPMPKLNQFCLAIQHHEGWYPGSRSYRNCNPGNVRYIGQTGSTGQDKNGFAVFPDYETGFNALQNMIKRAINGQSKVYRPDMTFIEFFHTYAPSSDNNDPNAYAEAVAAEVGVSPLAKINQLV